MEQKKGLCVWTDFIIQAAGVSDIGKVRAVNEDSFWFDMDIPVFCVADGAGGYESGAVASQLTIQAFNSSYTQSAVNSDDTIPVGYNVEMDPDKMKNAITMANSIIYEKSLVQKMASTVVSLCLNDGEAHIAHVGDSRIYLFRDNILQQLTLDHSLVMELFESGAITREEMDTHPKRNVITRAIGGAKEVDVDTKTIKMQKKDFFILCSDGLTGMVQDSVIEETLSAGEEDVEKIAMTLRDLALDGGGRDNITIVVVSVF